MAHPKTADASPLDALAALVLQAGVAERAELHTLLADIRQLVGSHDFARWALDPTRKAASRLAALRRVETMAEALPERDRQELAQDLRRLAFRAISSEGLLAAPTQTRATPIERAEVLLSYAASGALPRGAAGTAALKQARSLLRHEAAAAALAASPGLRRQLWALLEEAQEKLG